MRTLIAHVRLTAVWTTQPRERQRRVPNSFEQMAAGMGRFRLLEAMEGWNDATAGL